MALDWVKRQKVKMGMWRLFRKELQLELSDKSFEGDAKRDGVIEKQRKKGKKETARICQTSKLKEVQIERYWSSRSSLIQTGKQANRQEGQEHGNRNLYLRSLELSKAYKLTQDLIKSLVTVERGVRIKGILVTLETKSWSWSVITLKPKSWSYEERDGEGGDFLGSL